MVDRTEKLIRRKDIAEALEIPLCRVQYILKAYKVEPAKIEGSSRRSYYKLSDIERVRDRIREFMQ